MEPPVWEPPVTKFQDRVWLNVLLFVLTIGTTTRIGGPIYCLTVLLILGCHEAGHYLACRYYDVDASLPFFLPMPLEPMGTMGAFIRIREPIARKRILFDIGIAGPLAGFAIIVPALFLGVAWSNIQPMPRVPQQMLELGEPLLFKFAAWIFWGSPPDTYALIVHPVGHAALVGMLATALNLMPIGQLDGGHVSYVIFGKHSTRVTYATVAAVACLTFVALNWFFWTLVTVGMLAAFGPHHPRVMDEDVPLDRGRMMLAAAAVVMLVLCFTPVPFRFDFFGGNPNQAPTGQSTDSGSTSTMTRR